MTNPTPEQQRVIDDLRAVFERVEVKFIDSQCDFRVWIGIETTDGRPGHIEGWLSDLSVSVAQEMIAFPPQDIARAALNVLDAQLAAGPYTIRQPVTPGSAR